MGGCLLEIVRGIVIICIFAFLVVLIGLLALGLLACGASIAATIFIVVCVIAFLCYLFFASLLHLL